MKKLINWVKGFLAYASYVGTLARVYGVRHATKMVASQGGQISPSRIITLLIMAFVVIMFIISFVPELEDAIIGSTITNTFVTSMLEIMVWVLPIGALVAIIIAIFHQTRSRGG